MFSNWKNSEYHPSQLIKTLQLVLLVLIIVGIALLLTQKMWVPNVVNYILQVEKVEEIPVITPIVPPVTPVSGKLDSGVQGKVTIGPTCPVVRYPDDGTCADRPYKTTLIVSSNIPGKNGGVLVQTDEEGNFLKMLPPGTYTISSGAQVVMPRLSPVTFEVKAHQVVNLSIQFDSGIR